MTGSRDWKQYPVVMRGLTVAIEQLIEDNPEDRQIVVVHGACPTGADSMADDYVTKSRSFLATKGYTIRAERHPADFKGPLGRAAGPVRNKEMVDLGADICVAFNRGNSRGTGGTIKLAKAAGIEVLLYEAPR